MSKGKGLYTKYFVLNPNSKSLVHRTASRLAILVYAHIIESDESELADDLKNWMYDLGICDDIYKNMMSIIGAAWNLYNAKRSRRPSATTIMELHDWLENESRK